MSTLKEKINKTKKKVGIGLATTVAVAGGASVPVDSAAQGFHLEPVTEIPATNQAPTQQGTRTMSIDQFQQAQRQVNSAEQTLWASLPPHVQNEINSMGYQLSVEYSLKLNNALTPNSANKRYILYACAVTDIRQPGKVIYLPYYERDPRNNTRAMQPKTLNAQAAVTQQTNSTGVYRPEPNRFPTHTVTVGGRDGSVTVDNRGGFRIRDRNGSSIQRNGRNGSTRTVIRVGSRNR